jgi:hypothetical protein
MQTVAELLEWDADLMDLTAEYDLETENELMRANRMVAWLLMKRSIDGHEDLIETQLQSGTSDFNKAFKCIHSEFNRATTAHVNAMLTELFSLTMTQSQTGVRQFAAMIVRKANKLKDMGGGDTSEAQRLAIFMKGLPSPEYDPAKRQLRFSKVNNLAEAVTDTRDFAIAEGLENEAGMDIAPRKKHQMFNTEAKVEVCRNFAKAGKCRFGDKCHFSHSTKGQQSNVKKFGGTCYNCGKTGHKKIECRGRQKDHQQEDASSDDGHQNKKHQDHKSKGDGSQQKKHHENKRRGANERNLHFMGGASDEDDEDSYDMQKNEMFKEKQDRCFMFKDNYQNNNNNNNNNSNNNT